MTIVPILVVVALIMWKRLSATKKPIRGNGLRILLPVLFIMLGFSSVLQPNSHINTLEVCISILVGVVLSIPLIITTNYEVREDGRIYTRKSVAFIICILVIVAIRLCLRDVLQPYNPAAMLVMYFLVAFGYLVPWRVASYIKFRKVFRTLHT